jgi:hypothetical protein
MALIQRNGKLSGSANVCHRTQGCPQKREAGGARGKSSHYQIPCGLDSPGIESR